MAALLPSSVAGTVNIKPSRKCILGTNPSSFRTFSKLTPKAHLSKTLVELESPARTWNGKASQIGEESNRPHSPLGYPREPAGTASSSVPVSSETTPSSAATFPASSPSSPAAASPSSHGQTIIALGLTVHNAPVELREKLAVPEAEWSRAIQELCAYPHIDEAAVLSTCNRMELYVVGRSWHLSVLEVEHWLSRSSGLPIEQLRPYLFLLRDKEATHHLMRVSGGLDSLVLGEGQILAQVRQVFKQGQTCPGFGRQMSNLFKQAISAGKRVRTETSISNGHVSVSSAAVELAQMKLPKKSWEGVRVCVVGAGKMSSLLVKHLASEGCKAVTLINRTFPRANALKQDNPDIAVEVRLSDALMTCIDAADVIFFASGSEEVLVHRQDVEALPTPPRAAMGGVRRFVDISVPRNVAADVNDVDGAVLYNVDNLREVVAAHKGERLKAAAEAELLVSEEHGAFEAWKQSLAMVPTLKSLRNKAEALRQGEVRKALTRMQGASERGRLTRRQVKAVEDLSKAIVNKLLYGPVMSLRNEGADVESVSRIVDNMHAIERMFQLNTGGAGGAQGGASADEV